MSRRFQVDPFDLLGQEEPFPIAVKLRGTGAPNLSIAWNSFHQNFFSELAAFLRWQRVPKSGGGDNVFRDCRIQFGVPAKAIAAAALWHVVFFIVPWPELPGSAKRNPAFDNAELTWSGPIEDLPLLNVPKRVPKAAVKAVQGKPPADDTEAYHPRQRIFTDPTNPTHPRQTLVRPETSPEAPKFLPPMPNMVQLGATSGPARPRLEISEQMLTKLRPKLVKQRITQEPVADAPNLESRPTDVSVPMMAATVERPKLEINAGSAPRIAQNSKGETVAAPELAAGTNGAAATIIALSASPAPVAPVVEVPKGNLAARVALSPEGKGTGTGGSDPGKGSTIGTETGAEKSSMGIHISGGSPKPNASNPTAGGGAKLSVPRISAGAYKRPDASADDPSERSGPPNFLSLPPGAPPEQIFAAHRVYTMNVNMANLNSATGSWIIRFSELRLPGVKRASGDLNGPVPLRKIDPKYPQTAKQEHIEGEVILYGVIRADGSVDSIQLVRGVDEQLDGNAMAAFAQWKFQPATKSGQAVALEAIVHIPFRGPERP